MSAFLTDLVHSIFTPGPTRSLVVATNAAFASLQAVLLLLLVATFSIHFVILSLLSAGLWWSINWFVREVRAAHALEDEQRAPTAETAEAAEPFGDRDTDTATVVDPAHAVPGRTAAAMADARGELTARGHQRGRRSETSTEDEWERVSESEKDK